MAECRTEDAAQAGKSPARHIPEGTLPGPVRSQGRVGIDADEAEYLAEFLDRDECAQRGQQVPPQQAQLLQVSLQQPAGPRVSFPGR